MPLSGSMYPVIPVVNILIINGEKILLSQKKKSKYGGNIWMHQGGAVEEGETLERAAMREAYEEAGIRVELKKILNVENGIRDNILYINIYYLAEPIINEIPKVIEGDIFQDVSYFPLNDLPPSLSPDTDLIIRDFL